jgi:hypothetical protein
MFDMIFETRDKGWIYAVSSKGDGVWYAAQIASPAGDVQTHWYEGEAKARTALEDARANSNEFLAEAEEQEIVH